MLSNHCAATRSLIWRHFTDHLLLPPSLPSHMMDCWWWRTPKKGNQSLIPTSFHLRRRTWWHLWRCSFATASGWSCRSHRPGPCAESSPTRRCRYLLFLPVPRTWLFPRSAPNAKEKRFIYSWRTIGLVRNLFTIFSQVNIMWNVHVTLEPELINKSCFNNRLQAKSVRSNRETW